MKTFAAALYAFLSRNGIDPATVRVALRSTDPLSKSRLGCVQSADLEFLVLAGFENHSGWFWFLGPNAAKHKRHRYEGR